MEDRFKDLRYLNKPKAGWPAFLGALGIERFLVCLKGSLIMGHNFLLHYQDYVLFPAIFISIICSIGSFEDLLSNFNISISALCLYFLSHLLKVFRLVFIFEDHRIHFRKAILIQFKTNLPTLLLPFRVGDLYRASCFSEVTSLRKALMTLVIERYFDFLFLSGLFVVYSTFVLESTSSGKLLILSLSVSLLLYIFFFLRGNLLILKKILIHRNHTKLISVFYIYLSLLEGFLTNFKKVVNKKIGLLFILTSLIWSTEFFALFLIIVKVGKYGNTEVGGVVAEYFSPLNLVSRVPSGQISSWEYIYFSNVLIAAIFMSLLVVLGNSKKRGGVGV